MVVRGATPSHNSLSKRVFSGKIWPVHPRAEDICGLKAYPTAIDLPGVPDATFIGINRDATIGAVERLARMGAGGAVCFASGFGETADGQDANSRLLNAAGDMPILGPNCYGMINALDGVSLWPDQHGCLPVESGVAILTQSSNIAINLTMQKRGLPIAYVVTCGNQAQLSEAEIADALLDDPRVTAIGLHIEGFSDLPAWQAFARKAEAKNIPLVALKVGKSPRGAFGNRVAHRVFGRQRCRRTITFGPPWYRAGRRFADFDRNPENYACRRAAAIRQNCLHQLFGR